MVRVQSLADHSSVTSSHPPNFIFSTAMIGFPGFGLGVEARKRVTIGVELAAKPQLLLFLDGVKFSSPSPLSLTLLERPPTRCIFFFYRADVWIGWSECLQHRQIFEETF